MVTRNAFLSGLCGLAVVLGMMATSASGDVTTERGASILAFPKVLANGDFDTVIQISNNTTSMVTAHCFYVDTQLDATNEPLWQETDFTISLSKVQPTHWLVSSGRQVDPTDSCFSNNEVNGDCSGAGRDPGGIPPVAEGFIGELRCIEVENNSDNRPWPGNHLKGVATIKSLSGSEVTEGDVQKYSAIGFEANAEVADSNNRLQLNNPKGGTSGEYGACPETLIVNHPTEGVIESFEPGDPLTAGTNLTLIPCGADYENQICSQVTIQFLVTNEWEQRFSASTTVTCWESFFLHEVDSPRNPQLSIFSASTLGGTVAQTRITPVSGDGGIIGVASVVRDDGKNQARAAFNLHTEGDRVTDPTYEIVIPELR